MISRSFDGVAGGDFYARDALGRITQFQTTISGSVQTSNYSYDPAGRLARTVVTGPFATTTEYTYDNRGNRIAVNRDGTVTSAVFDNEDRLLSYGDLRFTYTEHGDLLRKENLVTGESLTLTYDQRGQLTRAQKSNGTVITYTIDGEGRRLTRSVNGVFETGYMHDTQGRLIAEVEPNGALRSHFVYASQSHSPDYMIRGGVKYFFSKSHLGSIRTVINSQTGAPSQQIRYDEFGRVLFNSNPGFQPFGFAGGHFDSETGLVRFGARDYDAEVGRWTAKDPILFKGGDANLYGYVLNDPVNFIDPIGLWRWPWSIMNEATRHAQDSGLPGAHNGLQDAFRHCLASCMMTQENGAFATWLFGEANEVKGNLMNNQERGERCMDSSNNAAGSQYGSSPGDTSSCITSCSGAATGGLLQTYTPGTTPGYGGK